MVDSDGEDDPMKAVYEDWALQRKMRDEEIFDELDAKAEAIRRVVDRWGIPEVPAGTSVHVGSEASGGEARIATENLPGSAEKEARIASENLPGSAPGPAARAPSCTSATSEVYLYRGKVDGTLYVDGGIMGAWMFEHVVCEADGSLLGSALEFLSGVFLRTF